MNSSNPDIKVKKRYNKFMAFLLANGVVATVLYIVMLAGGIANGSEIDAALRCHIYYPVYYSDNNIADIQKHAQGRTCSHMVQMLQNGHYHIC